MVSDKIRPTLVDAVRRHGANTGWQVLVHARAGRTVVNVPLGGGRFEQYAMDTQTGAWARWTGIDSHCWGVFDENAHFGADAGTVNRVTGNTDAGAAIEGDVQTAFNAFGRHGALKRLRLPPPGAARPAVPEASDRARRARPISGSVETHALGRGRIRPRTATARAGTKDGQSAPRRGLAAPTLTTWEGEPGLYRPGPTPGEATRSPKTAAAATPGTRP